MVIFVQIWSNFWVKRSFTLLSIAVISITWFIYFSFKLDIFEGGKDNLPDENSLTASRAIYQLADAAVANDLLIVLLSGGASALTSLPISGISIGEDFVVCLICFHNLSY